MRDERQRPDEVGRDHDPGARVTIADDACDGSRDPTRHPAGGGEEADGVRAILVVGVRASATTYAQPPMIELAFATCSRRSDGFEKTAPNADADSRTMLGSRALTARALQFHLRVGR